MSAAVSVIVAVYNVADCIERCLNSILDQTFHDFEVILVDDGSTDGSGEICDRYAEADSRFKVIHKENGGVGSARKAGIDNASGEYSIHIDPDDWVEADMLSTLYGAAAAQKADMLVCDYFEETACGSRLITQNPGELTNRNLIHGLAHKLHGSCCNKLIRLDCYRQHALNFIENLDYGEDTIMLLRLLQHPMKISYCPQAFYHYVRNNDKPTATNDFSEKMVQKKMRYLSYLAPYSRSLASNELVMLSYRCMKSGSLTKDVFKRIFSPQLKKIRINPGLPFRKLLAILLYLA